MIKKRNIYLINLEGLEKSNFNKKIILITNITTPPNFEGTDRKIA